MKSQILQSEKHFNLVLIFVSCFFWIVNMLGLGHINFILYSVERLIS
jgi:hypothetical protein